MERLTKDEYRELMDVAGSVAEFYISHIDDIKNNPDFSEAFKNIKKSRDVQVNDKVYSFPNNFRFIYRGNETICFIKDMHGEQGEYEDRIIYYLTAGFNKKIKMNIDYNTLVKNEYNPSNIYFEILENYDRKECGDVYGNGRIIYEEEKGYKGKIETKDNNCNLEYGKYDYDHTTVILLEETYESDSVIPRLQDLNKEVVTYKLTQGVNNPVYLALNEIQEAKFKKHYQRTR